MSRVSVLEEVRQMRFEEVYKLRTESRLKVSQAAQILGITGRTVRRWTKRFEEDD